MMTMHNVLLILTVIVCILIAQNETTLSKSNRGSKKKADDKSQTSGPATLTVRQRNLITQSPKPSDIITEHQAYCDVCAQDKNFAGPTLAYVTPWNNHGYDIAKMFNNKFNFVSPVWLQLRIYHGSSFAVEGGHDIDQGWMKEVNRNNNVQIVPRILFDRWTGHDFHALFSSEELIQDSIRTMLQFVQRHKFGGIVLEIWSQLGGQRRSELAHYISHVGQAFHSHGKVLALVLPPPISQGNRPGMVSADDFAAVIDDVDVVSLMTYDYSNPASPGPNAPLSWMKSCIELLAPDPQSSRRAKILLGLNFYGMDYYTNGVNPVLGHEYVTALKTQKSVTIKWDPTSAEHITKYRSKNIEHTVYYPTLYSLQERLSLAEKLGVGVAIWEIGQGLDYFYDLL